MLSEQLRGIAGTAGAEGMIMSRGPRNSGRPRAWFATTYQNSPSDQSDILGAEKWRREKVGSPFQGVTTNPHSTRSLAAGLAPTGFCLGVCVLLVGSSRRF
jgi:hypothetical protein